MVVPVNPLDRHDLRTRVDAALAEFLDRQGAALIAMSPELAPLPTALREFLDGGKLMRPGFCYWGWRGVAGRDGAELDPELEAGAVRAAASLELLQASALIHDDYMDGSDTRRGMPAIHRRFAAAHREAAWEGSDTRFGAAAAILLGDVCLTWCDEMFAGNGLPPERTAAARPYYDVMRTEVMAGQYLDVLAQAHGLDEPERAAQRAQTVIRFKSAKYTIERPLHVGAMLAGATPDVIAAYSAYGLPLGEAFQLRDDVLGVFGDPAATGKPAGDDLREGKQTLLVALAAARADSPATIKTLRAELGNPDLDAAGVAELQDIIRDTGALDDVETRITALTLEATAAADAAPIADEAREVLRELAVMATARKK
ncbi:polyprenyl synthetase family protein [Catenulispora yoronensis]|uniref:Polyprenyl synthetase family protein n=1 Tax=Catenulispora yoronensis TaxID=450799 RepID=A0ABN2URL1_9ACTN